MKVAFVWAEVASGLEMEVNFGVVDTFLHRIPAVFICSVFLSASKCT